MEFVAPLEHFTIRLLNFAYCVQLAVQAAAAQVSAQFA